ncbi:TonB family protein, partial [Rhodosalinus sediminis]
APRPDGIRPAPRATASVAARQGVQERREARQAETAGDRGGPEALGPGARQRLMAAWGGRIVASLERAKRYPRGMRGGGVVRLRLTVSHSGELAGVRVARSSGYDRLDRAAVEAARRARLPEAPEAMPAGAYPFTLAMRFAP